MSDTIPAPDDSEQQTYAYGHGGVPIFLLLVYLSFLVFFAWYTLEYQLPDFLQKGPGQTTEASE